MNINDYNNYKQLTQIPNNIIQYLMEHNDDIWLLLKYSDNDALTKQKLTISEKGGLIYSGQDDMSTYRVFMDAFTDDAFTEKCALLRVYPVTIFPENRVLGTIDIAIELMSNIKVNQLNNYSTRILTMLQQTIQCLNGADIGGVGTLFFDRNGSYQDMARLNIYNNKDFQGYTLIMSVKVSGDSYE